MSETVAAVAHRFEGVICAEQRFSDDHRKMMFLRDALRWPSEGVPLLLHPEGSRLGHGDMSSDCGRGLVEVGWVPTIYRTPGGLIRAEGHVYGPAESTSTAEFDAVRRALTLLGARGPWTRRSGVGHGGCSVELSHTKSLTERHRHIFTEGMIAAVTLVAQPAFKCARLRVVGRG